MHNNIGIRPWHILTRPGEGIHMLFQQGYRSTFDSPLKRLPSFTSFLTSAALGIMILHRPRAAESPSPLVPTTWLIFQQITIFFAFFFSMIDQIVEVIQRCNRIVINEIRRIIVLKSERDKSKEKGKMKTNIAIFICFLNCKNK